MEKPTLKKLLTFQEMELSSHKLKKLQFLLGEHLSVLHHCFFGCFHFSLTFTTVFWMLSLLIAFVHVTNFLTPDCSFTAFYQVLRFCVVVTQVLQIWESFFQLSGVFYLTLFPDIGNNLLLSICLFESHSVQQKVLVDRFYLYVKALQNSISTSSKFWTHYLIVICII